MRNGCYQIESNKPLTGKLLLRRDLLNLFVGDRGLAVSMAAKTLELVGGQEIRVVHLETGEVVFRRRFDDSSGALSQAQ